MHAPFNILRHTISERPSITHKATNGGKLPSPKHYAYENVDGQGSQVETQSTAMQEVNI